MKGAIAKAKEVAAERNGWVPLQFANPSNPAVHAATTGQEILEDFGAEGLDAFVAGIGTGGTISGVSKTLKAANPNIKVYGIEADESAVLNGDNQDHTKFKVSQLVSFLTHWIQNHMTVLCVFLLMSYRNITYIG